ncbi:DUF6325 family protein [Yinghuangia aomiensis]
MSELGPVDAIVLGFPGQRLTPAVLTAVDEVEARGDVRVIDMLIVVKDVHGDISHHEISEYEDMRDMAAEVAARRMLGLAGENDVEQIGLIMPPDSLVVVIFVENVWAREVAVRIREAGGGCCRTRGCRRRRSTRWRTRSKRRRRSGTVRRGTTEPPFVVGVAGCRRALRAWAAPGFCVRCVCRARRVPVCQAGRVPVSLAKTTTFDW